MSFALKSVLKFNSINAGTNYVPPNFELKDHHKKHHKKVHELTWDERVKILRNRQEDEIIAIDVWEDNLNMWEQVETKS